MLLYALPLTQRSVFLRMKPAAALQSVPRVPYAVGLRFGAAGTTALRSMCLSHIGATAHRHGRWLAAPRRVGCSKQGTLITLSRVLSTRRTAAMTVSEHGVLFRAATLALCVRSMRAHQMHRPKCSMQHACNAVAFAQPACGRAAS